MNTFSIKQYCLVIICFLLTGGINAQIVFDQNASRDNLFDGYLKSGNYYFKDTHNYLNNFVGVYQYTDGGHKFEIILEKITKEHVQNPSFQGPDYDYYEDGLSFQFKEYQNGVLIYTSPEEDYVSLYADDGTHLSGMISDYRRLTIDTSPSKEVTLFHDGGKALTPSAYIKRIISSNGSMQIKMHLTCIHCGKYDTETYEGQSYFSIPNRVVWTKK